MYPVNYPAVLPTTVLVERTPQGPVTLEPSRSYLQPGGESRRSPALIQIRPSPYRPPAAFDRETEDLVRMQEEFIFSCQYPLRKLPEETLSEAKHSYLHLLRKSERLGSPSEGTRRKSHRDYRSYSKSPSRAWRSSRRAERSKSRSPRRQARTEFSPPGAKSPASQSENTSTLLRNK